VRGSTENWTRRRPHYDDDGIVVGALPI